MKKTVLALAAALLAHGTAHAETLTVARRDVADVKPVFATVESVKALPARARIGGIVADLSVKEGDTVTQGQRLASIGDAKIVAAIRALEAEAEKARADLARAEDLSRRGVIPRAQLDAARAAANVAESRLKAQQQLIAEGDVLAPSEGRVLRVPVTAGSVVLPGDEIVTIAADEYLLRLRLPERHARFLKAGDAIELAQGEGAMTKGEIRLVYPEIREGRVVADAVVGGLGNYFVGERVSVLIATGTRPAILVPRKYVTTRFGVDYAHLQANEGKTLDIPVQMGAAWGEDVEILSGLKAGDVLVAP